MEQRVSLITLGVADVAASRAFYERLGWSAGMDVHETVFFQIGDSVLTLWSREKLAEDSGISDTRGWGGVTLAHNVRSREEVASIVERARKAGAAITREPAETFYGGYAGVFTDPDGHPWEIAHNPGFRLDDKGSLRLPES
ncbi:MAG: VOC family protein [Actinomycetota bacterium]